MHSALKQALTTSNGVIKKGQHPELDNRIDYAVRRGELARVLPGVYATVAATANWRSMVMAAMRWDPDAVIVREAAAALTFRNRLVPQCVEVASTRRIRSWPGFDFERRTVPADLILTKGRLRVADPALTAIDLVTTHGGDAIDWVLAGRAATLKGMYRALAASPNRRGNRDRRLMLLDSRKEPWSKAERLAHRVLRAAGVVGWRANVEVWCDGERYFLDIVMDGCPLVIEIDGWEFHSSREAFERDRHRGNLLALHGYQVLHFTWRMLVDEPEWVVETIRRALAAYDPSVF